MTAVLLQTSEGQIETLRRQVEDGAAQRPGLDDEIAQVRPRSDV